MELKIKLSDLKNRVNLLKPNINITCKETFTPSIIVDEVTPIELGLLVDMEDENKEIPYLSTTYVSVFAIPGTRIKPDLFMDIFLPKQTRGLRISMLSIKYEEFFSATFDTIEDNFRSFVINLLRDSSPVFIDEPTGAYLKDKTPWVYSDPSEEYLYTHAVWPQVMYKKKFHCEACFALEWDDARNILPKKLCVSCCKKNIRPVSPKAAFAKYLVKHGCNGSLMVEKLEKIIKLEQILGQKSLEKASLEQLSSLVIKLKKSGVKPEEIQSYKNVIKEYRDFCSNPGKMYNKPVTNKQEKEKKNVKLEPMVSSTSVNNVKKPIDPVEPGVSYHDSTAPDLSRSVDQWEMPGEQKKSGFGFKQDVGSTQPLHTIKQTRAETVVSFDVKEYHRPGMLKHGSNRVVKTPPKKSALTLFFLNIIDPFRRLFSRKK